MVFPKNEPFAMTDLSEGRSASSQLSPILVFGGNGLLKRSASLVPPQILSLKIGLNFNGYIFIAVIIWKVKMLSRYIIAFTDRDYFCAEGAHWGQKPSRFILCEVIVRPASLSAGGRERLIWGRQMICLQLMHVKWGWGGRAFPAVSSKYQERFRTKDFLAIPALTKESRER